MKTIKPPFLIAFCILVGTTIVTLVTFSQSIAQHTTITEVLRQPGVTVQVPGKIVKDSINYDIVKGVLRFDIVELKQGAKDAAPDAARLTIEYAQPKPENFDTATSVEAQGVYKDGIFHATNLLVKCPSKYNDQPAKQKTADASGGNWLIGIPITALACIGFAAGVNRFRRPGE